MTIIEEQPNETRAKRSFEPRFRQNGGAYSRGSPGHLHIEPDARRDQSNNDGSGLQWSTPLQAALAFPVRYQVFRETMIVYTTSYSLSYNVIRIKKRRFPPFPA
jgi:hypothetical protein